MKVKELIEQLQGIDPELNVVVFETKKHPDNAPLMNVLHVEECDTDDGDETVCMIDIEPNPETVFRGAVLSIPNAGSC